MKIMFICTGNTCRSAMAEAIMRKEVEKQKEKIEVFSCGIYASNGDSPTNAAIEVMQEMGIELKKHKAQNIRSSNIEEMDLILCATKSHKIMVRNLYPSLIDKIFTIKEYAYPEQEDIDILDPWGFSVDAYRKVARELDESIHTILKKINGQGNLAEPKNR